MTVLIRRAELTDRDALAGLVGEVQALHVARRPDTFRRLAKRELASWVREVFAQVGVEIWVAELDGFVRGYVIGVVREQTPNPFVLDRKWLELDQICVQHGYRQRGIAKALIAAAMAHANAQGIRDVELSTWAFNEDAQRAFSALGFAPKVVRFEAAERR